jgi:hypothetical protein
MIVTGSPPRRASDAIKRPIVPAPMITRGRPSVVVRDGPRMGGKVEVMAGGVEEGVGSTK